MIKEFGDLQHAEKRDYSYTEVTAPQTVDPRLRHIRAHRRSRRYREAERRRQQRELWRKRYQYAAILLATTWLLVACALGSLVGVVVMRRRSNGQESSASDERQVATEAPVTGPVEDSVVAPTAAPTAVLSIIRDIVTTSPSSTTITQSPTMTPTTTPTSVIPTRVPTYSPTIKPSRRPTLSILTSTKREVDETCAENTIDYDLGDSCKETCGPAYLDCCDPFHQQNAESVCELSNEVQGCTKYAKCQTLQSKITAPALLPLVCSTRFPDLAACKEICQPVACCFAEGDVNCMIEQFQLCLDWAPCQNLRPNEEKLWTAPYDLEAVCGGEEVLQECINACKVASCCEGPCLQQNMLACMTYSLCPESPISISAQHSIVTQPPPEAETICAVPTSDDCRNTCDVAACCWANKPADNCWTDDPLGCMNWQRYCSEVIGVAGVATSFIPPPPLKELGPYKPTLLSSALTPTPYTDDCSSTPECEFVAEALVAFYPRRNWNLVSQEGTCQNYAREWLMQDPKLFSYSPDRIRNRFTMVLLYCEWNGGDWLNDDNWLTEVHECEWATTHTAACLDGESYSFLYLPGQQLQGTIPPELSLMSSLIELNIADNLLSGTIPSELSELWVETLRLSSNLLGGTFPDELFDSEYGFEFDLSYNQLEGTLPSNLATRAPLLRDLLLDHNRFNGTIPEDWGDINWRRLHLNGNSFSGPIPSGMSSPQLEELFLHENGFTGRFPSEDFEGQINQLESLTLFGTELTGDITDTVCPMLTEDGNLKSVLIDPDKISCDCCELGY